MVGLSRRGKKRTTTNNTSEERRTYPLVTPAQRILQQQMDRPAVPQLPPRVRLPQGTVIALVPAKRPRTTKASAAEAADENRGLPDLEEIRGDVVVPALLSPLGSSNDGEVVRGEVRAKMADPAPTEQAERVITAHASSATDAASESVVAEVQQAPTTNNRVIVIADVHVPADTVHEQPGNSRQDAPVGDANREPLSLSQQEADQKFAEMVEYIQRCREGIAAKTGTIARLRREADTLKDRVRQIEAECAEEERSLQKLTNRVDAFKNFFKE